MNRQPKAALFLSCVTLLIFAKSESRAPETLSEQLNTVLSGRNTISISVAALSPVKQFRHVLRQEEFEEFVTSVGPDYVLEVRESSRAKRLLQTLLEGGLAQSRVPSDEIDVRYKVMIAPAGMSPIVFYVDGFGGILHNGMALQTRDGRNWIREVWELLERELVPSGKPDR